MKKLAMVLVLMIHCQWVNGQERFFNFVEGWQNNHSIEYENGYLLLGLGILNPGTGTHFFQYNYLDYSGELESEFSFNADSVDATSTYGTSQLATEQGGRLYIASLLGNYTPLTAWGSLFTYSPEDTTIDLVRSYQPQVNTQLHNVVSKNPNTLLLAGISSDNSAISLLVMQTDLSGDVEWDYTTSCGDQCRKSPQQILPLSNGHTAMLYKEHDLDQPTFHDREKAVIVVLDEQGEEVWSDEPGQHEDYRIWPGGMVELDGEILLSYTDPYYYMDDGEWDANFDCTIHFGRYGLDGTDLGPFDLQGQIPSGNSGGEFFDIFHQVTQMQLLPDGNLLISGHAGKSGLLIKMDTSGTLQWVRHHGPYPLTLGFYQQTKILHTLQTSDGGLLCTGEYISDPSEFEPSGIQTAFALKVDEYGCLEEGCGPVGLEEQAREENGILRLYPNPAQDHVILDYAIDKPFNAASFQLMDIQGRLISTIAINAEQGQVTLPLAVQPGVYLGRIVVDGVNSHTSKILMIE